MTKLKWNSSFRPKYNMGVDDVVLYPFEQPGVVWNGVIGITIKPETAGLLTTYIDGRKTLNVFQMEECAGTIEAFQSPVEFDKSDGSLSGYKATSHQPQKEPFNLAFCYRTEKGRVLKIIYNAKATPSDRVYSTGPQYDPETLSWDFSTQSFYLFGHSPTSSITIDMSTANSSATFRLLNILYGTEETPPRCPKPDEVLTIFEVFDALIVTNHGDGSFSISGSDSALRLLDDGEFLLDTDVVELLEEGAYQISYTPQ